MFVQNEEIGRRIAREVGEEKYKGEKGDKRQRKRLRKKETNPSNSHSSKVKSDLYMLRQLIYRPNFSQLNVQI